MSDTHDFRDSFNVRGSPPSLSVGGDGLTEEGVDTTGVRIPNPTHFSSEGFAAFAVKDGRIYRLGYDASARSVTHVFNAAHTAKAVVYVSTLDNPTEYTDIINFDEELEIHHDFGICATNRYLYVYASGQLAGAAREDHLYQIRLADHKARKMSVAGMNAGPDSFRGMIIDVDNDRKPYLLGNFESDMFVDSLLGWDEARGAKIWELDERSLVATQVRSQGGGDIRVVTVIHTDKSFPGSDSDEARWYFGKMGYIINGLLWNTCQVTRRHNTSYNNSILKWGGLAVWRWDLLEEYKLNGTGADQWIGMKTGNTEFPSFPEIDVLSDIGMSTPLDYTSEFQRFLAFCVDDQKVGWVSYMRANHEAPSDDPNEPFDSERNMYTHLYRYNLGEIETIQTVEEDVEPAEPYNFVWSEPNGYSFGHQLRNFISSNRTLGTVRCSINIELDGTYKIVRSGSRYTGISPYQINSNTGAIFVQPAAYHLLAAGSDRLTVAYELSNGVSSQIQVDIVVYARPTTTTPVPAATPIFFNTPYTARLPQGLASRRLVAHVFALRATSYRFGSGVSTTDWEINSATGQVYWIGSGGVADAPHTYSVLVEAVNSGLSGQTASVARTFITVSSYDPNPYVAPVLNSFWIPVGWTKNAQGVFVKDVDNDAMLDHVDMGMAVVEGSESRDNWVWRVAATDIETGKDAEALFTSHSSKFSMISVDAAHSSYDVFIHDGVQETEIATFTPSFTADKPSFGSFIYFYQGNSATSTTSLNVSVQENSAVAEILTAETERIYVLATPQSRYRSVAALVEKGSDKISVALGEISERSIGGTTNEVRRLHIFANGAALDYETDTSEQAVITATSIPYTAENDSTYKSEQGELTINIAVTDNASESPPTKYFGPQANPAWSPGSGWTRTGMITWSKDEDIGSSGAFELNVEDAIINGSNSNLSWTADSSDDSIGQAVVYQGRLVFRGSTEGDVTFTISVSDRTVTTVVAELDVSYSSPTTLSDSTVVFYRDGAELTEIDFEIVDTDAEEELDGSDIYVSVEEIENRTLDVESSHPTVVRTVLADDVEEITVGGNTKDVKQLQIYHNALAQAQGDIDGTITAEVYQTTVGTTIYSAASTDLTVDGEVDYHTVDAEIQLWKKHRTTGDSEQITEVEILALKGTDTGSHRFPVDTTYGTLGDYDYYIVVNVRDIVLGETDPDAYTTVGTIVGATQLGDTLVSRPYKTYFELDVDDNTDVFTTPNMVPQTTTFASFVNLGMTFEDHKITPRINTNSGMVLVNNGTMSFTVSGEVQVLSNIKLYNGNVRTQQTSLEMEDTNIWQTRREWFPEIGGDSYITFEQIANRPVSVSFANVEDNMHVQLSSNTTQVVVRREGGGLETLTMKQLTLYADTYYTPSGVADSAVIVVDLDEYVNNGNIYRAEELRIPVTGTIVEPTYEALTRATTEPTNYCEHTWDSFDDGVSWTNAADLLWITIGSQFTESWLPVDMHSLFEEGSVPHRIWKIRFGFWEQEIFDDGSRRDFAVPFTTLLSGDVGINRLGIWFQERYTTSAMLPVSHHNQQIIEANDGVNAVASRRIAVAVHTSSSLETTEFQLHHATSNTTTETIESIDVVADRSQRRQEVFADENDGIYISATNLITDSRYTAVVVSEGAEYITAKLGDTKTFVDGDDTIETQRIHLYTCGSEMTADNLKAQISMYIAASDEYERDVVHCPVNITHTGDRTSEPVYIAPYINFGWHPCVGGELIIGGETETLIWNREGDISWSLNTVHLDSQVRIDLSYLNEYNDYNCVYYGSEYVWYSVADGSHIFADDSPTSIAPNARVPPANSGNPAHSLNINNNNQARGTFNYTLTATDGFVSYEVMKLAITYTGTL